MTKENINPLEHYYAPETKVEIPGGFLMELIALTEQLMASELKTESEFKFIYLNEKGVPTKKFTKEDVDTGKVKKVVDWEKTIDNPTYKHSLTEKGVGYAKLKKFLEATHMSNIENGLTLKYGQSATS